MDGPSRYWRGRSGCSDASRPYPSGGAAYELELYLAVNKCDGLPQGFYHYDAERHTSTPIQVNPELLEAQLADAKFAIGASGFPQILIGDCGAVRPGVLEI